MKNKIVLKPLIKLLCVLIMILIFSPLPVSHANDGVLGVTPDGVYPITQSDIMMKSEEIYIDCTTGKVTCRFDFKNLGGKQTVLMGFPARLNENIEYTAFTTEEDVSIRNFTAKDKHGDIPVVLADTIPNPPLKKIDGMEEYSKWYTFSVDFKENEEKTLYHTYDVNFAYTSDGSVYMGYVIETGSHWRGPIGHSIVVFDMGESPMYSLTYVFPNNYYRIDGNKLIFERRDFKPEYNLSVTKNEFRYSDEWLNNFVGENDRDNLKEAAQKKIELFNTSPDAIRKNSQKYFKLYQELINSDPISALYIKSALALPNGNEKPEITGCRIAEHVGNTWRLELCGTDPDSDIVRYMAEIDGIEKFRYMDDGGGLYYNNEEMKFIGHGYLELQGDVKKTTPFSITFTLLDSAGNSDTETILLQANPPGPDPGATPVITPQATPAAESPNKDATIPAYESANKGEKVILMEEETIPLLIIGVLFVLFVSLVIIIVLFIKRKNWGYLLFVAQLTFIGLSLYQLIDLLNIRDNTDGVMSSEIVSLKIGVSAVFWALSMLCMLGGIILTTRESRSKVLI